MKKSELKSLIREIIKEEVHPGTTEVDPKIFNGKTIKSAVLNNQYELQLNFSDGNVFYVLGGINGYDGELQISSKKHFN